MSRKVPLVIQTFPKSRTLQSGKPRKARLVAFARFLSPSNPYDTVKV